ncbi:MAG: class I mannose-6-phosphate isomerase [Acidobacteriaceae bacterium]|nr:class I mannose-6-phosphate isomerase [Acidobacteriaceae bacterium]
MTEFQQPIELLPIFRERVWGRESLEPFFRNEGILRTEPERRIGEVWFTCEENPTSAGTNLGSLLRHHPEILGQAGDRRHPGVCPILLKLLFTTERLSVQVHPDDAYAWRYHQSLGKTEAWYVLDSQPPGEVAVGLRRPVSPDEFESSIESGEIENLLDWRPVERGDVIFTPAGTVHAIGARLTICEIQQNSDITYRLYDYGRPRELHVEHGAAVSHLGPHDCTTARTEISEGREQLVTCDYFRIERLRPKSAFAFSNPLPYYMILICTSGSGTFNGASFRAGQAWLAPANSAKFSLDGPGSEWILTYAAPEAAGFSAS